MRDKPPKTSSNALFACALGLLIWTNDAEAKIPRSRAAIAEFKLLQPCPASHRSRGPCPGYEIDHRIPLKCGGPDDPANMQWLTIDKHKIKTAREAMWCRRQAFSNRVGREYESN